MAVFECECEDCGKRFETVVPITEHDKLPEKPPECPERETGTKTRQLVSPFHGKTPRG